MGPVIFLPLDMPRSEAGVRNFNRFATVSISEPDDYGVKRYGQANAPYIRQVLERRLLQSLYLVKEFIV